MENDPDLFPKLNLTRLKIQAEKWANDDELIIRVTLHHPKSARNHMGRYVLVWEVLDPMNEKYYGLDYAIKKAANSYYGEGFAEVYKDKQDCPRRFSEEWDTAYIGPGDGFPDTVLANKFWLLYDSMDEKFADKKSGQVKLLIRKAGPEVKMFYEQVLSKKPSSLETSEAKDLLKTAINEVESNNYIYIKKINLDEALFRLSNRREWPYFKERMLKKILEGANLGKITQKECGEIYKEIFG